MTVIRPALPSDAPSLQEIERLAGEQFRDVGLDHVAEDEPKPVDVLAAYADSGRAWVAIDGGSHSDSDNQAIGYVLVDVVDGCAHVEQMSVNPDHQGTGVGRALLDRVRGWAAETGRFGITLTTFRDVPWNRPLYEHLGFRVLSDAEIGPEMRALRATEAIAGLEPEARVCMRLALDG